MALTHTKGLELASLAVQTNKPAAAPSRSTSKSRSHLVESNGKTSRARSPFSNGTTSDDSTKVKRKSSRLSQKKLTPPGLKASPILNDSSVSDSGENGVTGIIKRGSMLVFVEPPPAESKPVYTGFPLEAFPPAKVKKEAFWPVKRKKWARKPKEDTPTDDMVLSDNELSNIKNIESKYIKNLPARAGVETNPSNIRTGLKIKLRQNIKSDASKTPKSGKRKQESQTTPGRHSKRIKVISPKKHASTNLAPIPLTEDGDKKPEDDETKDNDDFCSACGGSGIFICCENCPKSFHFTCCYPPLEDVPEDEWFCRECMALKHPELVTTWNSVGIFGQLLNQLESRNPVEFQLPRDMRENTFIGVTTGDHGDYEDDSFLPELTQAKANGSQIKGFNKNVDLEIESLYDKNGDPYLCHKCGDSGLNRRTLAHCHYCSLVWHIDCLSIPMCSPKTIGTKWRCPNHVEDLLPQNFLNFRILKDTKIRDVSLYNHFASIANMSNFVIQHDNQPYLKDKAYPHLIDYLQYEDEDFGADSVDSSPSSQTSDKVQLPRFFQNVSVQNGVSAKISAKLNKVINENGKNSIYRVPEKLIVLDFISKVNKDTKLSIVENLDQYEYQARVETNKEENEVYEALVSIKSNPRNQPGFAQLVTAASQDQPTDTTTKPNIGAEELEDLLHIKKLMELKGREALLKFLQS